MSAMPQLAHVHGSAPKLGNIVTVLEKRNDKASFMACMFPYMQDYREHIMGFSNIDALS
jgi:hypothetical protein